MGAFNRRFQPKEMFGLPLAAMLGMVGALVFGVLALSLPYFFLIFTLPLMTLCIFTTVASFWLGDELPFVPLMLASRRERRASTRDVWSDL
jgi:hypothetical protein